MKKDHLLISIGIVGVVVAVWAALRNRGTSPTVVVQASPSLSPMGFGLGQGSTPLGAPAVQELTPANAPGIPTVQEARPGTSGSGVPEYSAQTQLMAGGELQQAASGVRNIPTFYTGPIMQFLDSMIPRTDAFAAGTSPKSSCGCGEKSSGCTSCTSSCATNNSNYPDGRGGCLAFNRKKQVAQALKSSPDAFFAVSENTKSSGIDNFDVFQQTVFDHFAASYGTPPASPFLSPV